MKRKRFLSLMTAVGILLANLPMMPVTMPMTVLTVSAKDHVLNSGTCGENLTWTLDSEGTLTVSGTGDMVDFEDSSPAPWKDLAKNIKNAKLNEGVTSIGKNAFDGCTVMRSIVIPESVTSIGESAFYGCKALEYATLPKSVTQIQKLTFQGCSSLKELTLPDSITGIGDYAYYGCAGLSTVTLSKNLKSIGVNAFAFCSKLSAITIPKSVEVIDACAFIDCSSLHTIIIINPNCSLDMIEGTSMVPKTTTINGYCDSTAQRYAEKYGYPFRSMGEVPFSVTTTPQPTTTTTTSTTPNPTTTATTITTISESTETTVTTGTTESSASDVILGNVNGDKEISVEDAQLTLNAYVNGMSGMDSGLTAQQLKAADINGDGDVSVDDAQLILLYYVSNTLSGQSVTWDELIRTNAPAKSRPQSPAFKSLNMAYDRKTS